MPRLEAASLDKPQERRDFPQGHLEIVQLTGVVIGRSTFDPGWRWSESVKPIAGTDSCQFHHKGYLVSGRMHVRMDDGAESELGAGDAVVIPPGHDAWVVGDEQVVVLDFSEEVDQYAKPR